jgi:ABC-type transport system involved in multi-copper enzyme maturation permease subunit
MKIKAIALNTFREAIRDRILYVILFFAAVCFLFSRVLALLTVGDQVKIITDVTLLSKPIHRYQFLLGKYFGMILTLFVMLFLMTVLFLILLFFHTFKLEWQIFAAVFLIFCELCLITAVAILFSCFSTPILSSIYTLSFYLIGHLSWGLETLIDKINSGVGRALARVLYTLLPDLENFNIKTEIVHHLPIPSELFLFSFLYGLCYSVFILFLAVLVFRRRDFI